MKAVLMETSGGPDVMQYVEQPTPTPRPGEVLVQVAAAGVNFMDMGVRQGQFWTELPYPKAIGVEGAGRVVTVGEGVRDFVPGQRVAWAYAPGSYAEMVSVPAASLVSVPEGVDDEVAASIMMAGLTASHFATEFYPVRAGDVALVHAAAGGVGLLLTQIIKLRGGRVIGRVSSESKTAVARAAGANHVIVDTSGQFAAEAIRLTDGEGVDVVYDGSGPVTFQGSIDALKVAGTLCWYGPILGGPGLIDIMSLPKSVKIGYAVYAHHVRTPERLRAHAAQLFQWILDGELQPNIGRRYPLKDAARAHADMESRATTGKLLLVPDDA
ncbi:MULTISPECIES: quinone oxidoreductase [unclassified Cupriavidus]|uniref:quinone oxidoreductase family protein n=1 Tax=unclassified Cupriavidus TaxID=2640874 RepID=UPI001C006C9F|nr:MULTISPECIES: quinone oxidoreductase [unclassified Cupriavidus]MCA3183282.1 quinone oxidoreductase [Cupriavidus sp.]MCA3191941.1 quinone oxidoreductase [Cupriavidus sp.]MCA3197686.1 quinone oxidoreductase [Cupriavidus sp.]MCA3202738.1 quinone oxidoreductase [Cupriavidus sp.]MCA3208932.1 quinone oxidoreductase [Cupriavidus sp.]